MAADWSIVGNHKHVAFGFRVEPLGERAPLVAGFAVAKKLPEHGRVRRSARKKDEPFRRSDMARR